MCNQAVSLVAAECERQGISSVAIVLLREVAQKVRPPRALFAPFAHGYPLGLPDDAPLQRRIIESALHLLEDENSQPGVIAEAPSTNLP